MNHWAGIGRLTTSPDITSNSVLIAKFTLAVDRQFKKEGQPEADFIRCTAFGKSAEFAQKYLHKGLKMGIEGRIATGSYEKDGVKHFTTEIIVEHMDFCEGKKSGSGSNGEYPPPPDDSDIPPDYSEITGDDAQLPF